MLLEFEDGPLPGEAPPVGDGLTAVMMPVAVPNPNELVEAPGPGVRSEGVQPEGPAPIGPALDPGTPDPPICSGPARPPESPGVFEAIGLRL